MGYALAADVLVVIHLGFVVFVMLGGLLLARWPWLVVAHLPAVIWAALAEYNSWLCPLTPLENQWRRAAGEQGYSTDFISHYIQPILYPANLTAEIQVVLAIVVLLVNGFIYAWLITRRWRKR